jgi:NhaA family Na+:H+ antiporter
VPRAGEEAAGEEGGRGVGLALQKTGRPHRYTGDNSPSMDSVVQLRRDVFTRFSQFIRTESASGFILLACTALAMLWANSPFAEGYFALWHRQFTIGPAGSELTMDLHHWINDGLMALFFFVVGLEIKRELLVGELSNVRAALLPIFGALGGMLVPALIYAALNWGSPSLRGWGIPMATDIAFAVAILALLGPRVPVGLKVFLVALAIVDDLGAVLVIALFYTADLNFAALALAIAAIAAAGILNAAGVMKVMPYVIVGIVAWLAMLTSGVHATVAGVLLALMIPARARIDVGEFAARSLAIVQRFTGTFGGDGETHTERRLTHDQLNLAGELESACEQVQPPLDRLQHSMHGLVAFVIMPLFALSNAGVAIPAGFSTVIASPVSLGVMLGLLLGKQVGVYVFVWLAVRLKLAVLPDNVSWRQIHGAAVVCGVGFTMSLFVSNLAFGPESAETDGAKLGILLASTLAGLIGYFALHSAWQSPGSRSAA